MLNQVKWIEVGPARLLANSRCELFRQDSGGAETELSLVFSVVVVAVVILLYKTRV